MYNEYIAKQFNNYLMSKCRIVTGEQADLAAGNGEEFAEWETADLSLQSSRQQQGEEDQHGVSEPESYTESYAHKKACICS